VINPFIWVGVGLLLVAAVAAVMAVGLLPAGVPGGRPTVTARPLSAHDAVIHAFFREVRDPDARFTVDIDGTMTFSGVENPPPPIEMSGSFRLHGEDWEGAERLVQDEETFFEMEMVLVDDIGYVRERGGEWINGEVPDRLQPISPFRRISAVTDVDYVDEIAGSGLPTHRLVVGKWLGGRTLSDMLRGFARVVSKDSRMEVVVDQFGVPSTAELGLTVVATDGVDTITVDAVVTYRIGSWDDVEPIEPPLPIDPAAGPIRVL
jgi:hypothetical protein